MKILKKSFFYLSLVSFSFSYISASEPLSEETSADRIERQDATFFSENVHDLTKTKVSVLLNGQQTQLEVQTIISLAERILKPSNAALKRNLKPETVLAIQNALGHVRSVVQNGQDLTASNMKPIFENLLKNCVKAHYGDVNKMFDKLGLDQTEKSILEATLKNAATLLTSEDPVSIQGVVNCCASLAPTIAELLMQKYT